MNEVGIKVYYECPGKASPSQSHQGLPLYKHFILFRKIVPKLNLCTQKRVTKLLNILKCQEKNYKNFN